MSVGHAARVLGLQRCSAPSCTVSYTPAGPARMHRAGVGNRDTHVAPLRAEEVPRLPLRSQHPAAHYLNGRAALNGPHRGTVGRGRGGGTATSGESAGNGGWGSTRSTLRSRHRIHRLPCQTRRPRAEPRVGRERAAHVVTAGGRPPNGHAIELGSPYIKYKGSCLILAVSRHASPNRGPCRRSAGSPAAVPR